MLGKPPQRSPVIPEVIARLGDAGVAVHVHVQDRAAGIPDWIHDTVDVVAVRGWRSSMLRALLEAEEAGVIFADPPSSLLAVRDRGSVHDRLAAAGIAVPTFRRSTSWSEIRRLARSGQVVVKHASGEVGRGARVFRSRDASVPAEPPFPGPYLVENHVHTDTPEAKLYRFGNRVVAAPATPTGTAIPITEPYTELAHRVAATLKLTTCGIDVLEGPRGPTVVDINPFPSARRIHGAAMLISAHLLDLAASDHHHARAAEAEVEWVNR